MISSLAGQASSLSTNVSLVNLSHSNDVNDRQQLLLTLRVLQYSSSSPLHSRQQLYTLVRS